MPRPCIQHHPEPIPGSCRVCYLSLNDPRYAKLWGEPDIKESPIMKGKLPKLNSDLITLDCIYRKEIIGSVKSCASCQVYSCLIHGSCTKHRDFRPEHSCCRLCPDRMKEEDYATVR